MSTFDQYLNESINDKGKFKAIFVCGISGAGKSYTIQRLKGEYDPRVVNTDSALEFLINKEKVVANRETWKSIYSDRTKTITRARLFSYLNGMLPLFIDGTSNDVSNILTRMGILKGLGYDVGVVFIKTDIDVALARVKERNKGGREVPQDFIERVYKESEEAEKLLKSEVSFFKEFHNNGELDDEALLELYRSVSKFYGEPNVNFVAKKTIKSLEEHKESYLIPTIMNKEVLKRKVDLWYKNK